MSSKGNRPYRNVTKRRLRRDRQIEQTKRDRAKLKNKPPIKIWYKSVSNKTIPTDYLIVEFNLKNKLSANEFECILNEKLEGII